MAHTSNTDFPQAAETSGIPRAWPKAYRANSDQLFVQEISAAEKCFFGRGSSARAFAYPPVCWLAPRIFIFCVFLCSTTSLDDDTSSRRSSRRSLSDFVFGGSSFNADAKIYTPTSKKTHELTEQYISSLDDPPTLGDVGKKESTSSISILPPLNASYADSGAEQVQGSSDITDITDTTLITDVDGVKVSELRNNIEDVDLPWFDRFMQHLDHEITPSISSRYGKNKSNKNGDILTEDEFVNILASGLERSTARTILRELRADNVTNKMLNKLVHSKSVPTAEQLKNVNEAHVQEVMFLFLCVVLTYFCFQIRFRALEVCFGGRSFSLP